MFNQLFWVFELQVLKCWICLQRVDQAFVKELAVLFRNMKRAVVSHKGSEEPAELYFGTFNGIDVCSLNLAELDWAGWHRVWSLTSLIP
jgi:hypothetical protein